MINNSLSVKLYPKIVDKFFYKTFKPITGPDVELSLSMSPTEAQKILENRKSTIGNRKPTGAKKGVQSNCIIYTTTLSTFLILKFSAVGCSQGFGSSKSQRQLWRN